MNIEFLVVIDALLLVRLINLYPFQHTSRGRLSSLRPVMQATLLIIGYLLLFQLNSVCLVLLSSMVALIFLGEFMIERSSHEEAMGLMILGIMLLLAGILASVGDGLAFRPLAVTLFSLIDRHVPLVDLSLSVTDANSWLILTGILLLANEANLLVRAVFRYCGLTPDRQAALRQEAITAKQTRLALRDHDAPDQRYVGAPDGSGTGHRERDDSFESMEAPINDGAFRAGRVIGFLERWLMLLVILGSNDLSALAFIIAAKGLARMKQLEDRAFAEYMLIGTLMSALLSLVVGLWIEQYL